MGKQNTLKKGKSVALTAVSAALVAGVIFVVICLLKSIAPFGSDSILRNDGIHQYAPFLVELVERVKSGSSLFYSWNSGMGTNEFGTICYYLLSPFNFIAFFFNSKNISMAMTIIILLKTMFVSAFFNIFLQKKFDRHDASTIAFSLLYTFCGFYMAFYYNTMWLDALFMLPLIALGIENIVNGKKATLYFFALAYTIFVNFYMAYMICIFAVIYFFLLVFSNEITNKKKKDDTDVTKAEKGEAPIGPVLLKFGVSSLFAGLVCAVVILPIVYSISNTFVKNAFDTEGLLFNVGDFFVNLLSSVRPRLVETTLDAAPYIASGMLTFVLLPLYLCTKSIKWNEKIANVIVLLLFFFSFQVPAMNYFWHGLSAPASLPYRFSYLFSFLIIVLAYKTFIRIKEIPIWAFLFPAAIITATIIYAPFSTYNEYHITTSTLIISGVAAAVFMILLIMKKYLKNGKQAIGVVLTLCVAGEAVVCGHSVITSYADINGAFYNQIDQSKEVNEYIAQNDDSEFTRMEIHQDADLKNPGALYNYNGISSFSSLNDTAFSTVQFDLGNSGNLGNSFQYNSQSALYNSIFGVKYLYDVTGTISEDNIYAENVYTVNSKPVYKNKNILPLGYCVDSTITDWDPYTALSLVTQYSLWLSATGVSGIYDFTKADALDYSNCYAVPFSEVSQYIEDNVDENTSYQEEEAHVHDENCNHDEEEVGKVDENAEVIDYGALTTRTLGEILDAIGEVFPFKGTDDNFSVSFDYTAQKDGEMYALVSSGCLQTLTITYQDGSQREIGIAKRQINDIGYLKAGEKVTLTVSNSDRSLSEFNADYPITDSIQMSVATLDDEKFLEGYNHIIENGVLNIDEFEDTYIKGTVNASKDGMMMMSMPYDEGWTVYIDGEETQLHQHMSHIMMFEMPEGEHTVEMKYVPQGLVEGAFVSVASILALALVILLNKMHSMKAELSEETTDESASDKKTDNVDNSENKEE